MDFGKAFTYQFDDEDKWKKLLLTGLLCIIPIFGQIYGLGWMLSIMKRVQDNHPVPLPEGFDIGGNLILGLKGIVVGIVYSIPIFIVYVIAFVPYVILVFITDFVDYGTGDILVLIIFFFSLGFSGLAVILSVGINLLLPAAYGRLNIDGSIGDALQFKEVFYMVKSNIGVFFFALLGTFVAGIIKELGEIACVVGLLFTIPYAFTIMAHLYGQAYKASSVSAT